MTMKFSEMAVSFADKILFAANSGSIGIDDSCPSLTPMLCPEIIRLINEYNLSSHHYEAATDG